jgi:hypothetical protein
MRPLVPWFGFFTLTLTLTRASLNDNFHWMEPNPQTVHCVRDRFVGAFSVCEH